MRSNFLFLLALWPCFVIGQTATQKRYTDSLKTELSVSKPDTSRIATLIDLSFQLSTLDVDSGINYGKKAVELSRKQTNQKWLAKSLSTLAISYGKKSDYTTAIALHNEALVLHRKAKDRSREAGVYSNLASLYMVQSDYSPALRYAFDALKIYEEIKEPYNIALVTENIGHIYYEQKNFQSTEENYKKALALYKVHGKPRDIARLKGNMARIYTDQRKYNKALELLVEALSENEKAGLESSVQINLANIGNVYAQLGDYSKALQYHTRALRISEKLGIKMYLAINHGNLGGTFLKYAKESSNEEFIDKAIHHLNKSMILCSEINLLAPQAEFSIDLAEAYKIKGQFKLAFETLEAGTKLHDSVFSDETKIQLAKLESQREIDLKNKDIIIKNKQLVINNLERERERNFFIGGILLLLIALAVLVRFFVNRARIQKKDMDDMIQIQAHAIRGPVASILGLAQLLDLSRHDDPDNKELIAGISSLATDLDEVIVKFIKEAKR